MHGMEPWSNAAGQPKSNSDLPCNMVAMDVLWATRDIDRGWVGHVPQVLHAKGKPASHTALASGFTVDSGLGQQTESLSQVKQSPGTILWITTCFPLPWTLTSVT